jgi:hypothetical protein
MTVNVKRLFKTIFLLVFAFALPLFGQYVAPYVSVQGTLSSSNGMPAKNFVLSFQPTQLFFIGGTSVVVSGSTCGTDVTGAVVGVRNPLSNPVVSVTLGTGTLPAATYWVAVSWYDTYSHQTLVSPIVTAQLTSAGSLNVSPPVAGAPANALGMNVYIGTSASALTYQGHTVTTTATYVQSSALTTGAATPTVNTTVCQVVANDAGWPTGTGYNVSLSDPSGNTMPGYPMQWQFTGPGSAYNLSNGLPYYDGRVSYPAPLLTQPYNHNMQSINGPLSMGTPGGIGYNIVNVNEIGVGTQLPAWGVDVEGSALAGAINAKTGYLLNGAAGAAGQCLVSDGTYFDTPASCISALPTIYYQTVSRDNISLTQRPTLNFSTAFGVTDGSSPAATTVDLATLIAAGSCTNCALSYDAYGRTLTATSGNPLPYIEELEVAGCSISSGGSYSECSVNFTWTTPFSDATYVASCTGVNPTSTGAEWQATLSGFSSKTAAGLTVNVTTQGTSYPQGFGFVDCIAVCKAGASCQP